MVSNKFFDCVACFSATTCLLTDLRAMAFKALDQTTKKSVLGEDEFPVRELRTFAKTSAFRQPAPANVTERTSKAPKTGKSGPDFLSEGP